MNTRRDVNAAHTILLVEDDFQLLAVLSSFLEDQGYSVLKSHSGQEAIDRVDLGEDFDLLLTDVVMPGKVGGFELANYIRGVQPNVPIIYMSGYAVGPGDTECTVDAPLLQKPTTTADLTAAISKALGEAA